jgi:cell division protein FtsX
LLAWLLVALVVGLAAGPIERVAALYASAFRLQGLDRNALLALLAGGPALGWIGSWLTASYHLRRIEPSA